LRHTLLAACDVAGGQSATLRNDLGGMDAGRRDAIEDDLTAFIQYLLAARVESLGWSVGDQSKGGFSAKGNTGERDLTWGSSVLALIEAVICDRPLTQDVMKADLESHFQKLLGYGNPMCIRRSAAGFLTDTILPRAAKRARIQFVRRRAGGEAGGCGLTSPLRAKYDYVASAES
jgi:hypothetical protein